uniref:hypothetical protein n=1 Tax=Chamaesiphon sp. VAR_48_metabat_403 TaxID=2964700 RepID=UPI00286E7035
ISNRVDILAEIVGIAAPKENRLLTIKATTNEATTILASPILNDFIRSEIYSCEAAIKLIPKHETDTLAIDRLFKQYAIANS